jgi:hypothetical protein
VPRLFEIAALYLALVCAGAIIATPTFPAEARVAALAAILAGFVYLSRRRSRS